MSDERRPSQPPPAEQRPIARPPNTGSLGADANPKSDRAALRLIANLSSPGLYGEPYNAGEVARKSRELALLRLVEPSDSMNSRMALLHYLIGVAQNTQGAEVWRALFSEIQDKLSADWELEQA